MREAYEANDVGAMLYDASAVDQIDPELFRPGYWRTRGAGLEKADGGRGQVVFVGEAGNQWALRHYRRGGLPGRLLRDQFLFVGENATRSFREFRLLARLHRMGLPVPRPVAARYVRHGLIYRADLVTARIEDARPLPVLLAEAALKDEAWARLGRIIRRFHDAGVCHADLNAHNILRDGSGKFWLLDFDRGQIRRPGAWDKGNLARLRRSLLKIRGQQPQLHLDNGHWDRLVEGYERGEIRAGR